MGSSLVPNQCHMHLTILCRRIVAVVGFGNELNVNRLFQT